MSQRFHAAVTILVMMCLCQVAEAQSSTFRRILIDRQLEAVVPARWQTLDGEIADQVATAVEAMVDNQKIQDVQGVDGLVTLYPSKSLHRASKINITRARGNAASQEQMRSLSPLQISALNEPLRTAVLNVLPTGARLVSWEPVAVHLQNGTVVLVSNFQIANQDGSVDVVRQYAVAVTDRVLTVLCGYDAQLEYLYAPVCERVLRSVQLVQRAK